mgnify:CR=1 FL=1
MSQQPSDALHDPTTSDGALGISDYPTPHTDRQSTLLVRTDGPVRDPSWTVHELTLEDLILAYLADRDAHPIATARTDASGVAFFALPATTAGQRIAIRAAKGGDRAVLVFDPSAAMNSAALGASTQGSTVAAGTPVASV